MSLTPPDDGRSTTVVDVLRFSQRNLADMPPAKISPQQADEMLLDSLPNANNFDNASVGLTRLEADTTASVSFNKWESSDYLSALDRFTTQKIESGNSIMETVKKTILERKSQLIAVKYSVPKETVYEIMKIGSVDEMEVRVNISERATKTLEENRIRYVVIEPSDKPNKQVSCPIISISETDYTVDENGFLYKTYNPTGGTVYDGSDIRIELRPVRELVIDQTTKGSLPKIEGQTSQLDFLTLHGLTEGLDGAKAMTPEFIQFKPDKEIKGVMSKKVDRPDKTRVSKESPIPPVTEGFSNRIVSTGPGAIDGMHGFKGLLRRLAPPPVTYA